MGLEVLVVQPSQLLFAKFLPSYKALRTQFGEFLKVTVSKFMFRYPTQTQKVQRLQFLWLHTR